ncbi:MAG: hypothetical protein WAO98_00230 [Alphaproteobacteria bacterium]
MTRSKIINSFLQVGDEILRPSRKRDLAKIISHLTSNPESRDLLCRDAEGLFSFIRKLDPDSQAKIVGANALNSAERGYSNITIEFLESFSPLQRAIVLSSKYAAFALANTGYGENLAGYFKSMEPEHKMAVLYTDLVVASLIQADQTDLIAEVLEGASVEQQISIIAGENVTAVLAHHGFAKFIADLVEKVDQKQGMVILSQHGAISGLAKNGEANTVLKFTREAESNIQAGLLTGFFAVSGLTKTGHAESVVEILKGMAPAHCAYVLAAGNSQNVLHLVEAGFIDDVLQFLRDMNSDCRAAVLGSYDAVYALAANGRSVEAVEFIREFDLPTQTKILKANRSMRGLADNGQSQFVLEVLSKLDEQQRQELLMDVKRNFYAIYNKNSNRDCTPTVEEVIRYLNNPIEGKRPKAPRAKNNPRKET